MQDRITKNSWRLQDMGESRLRSVPGKWVMFNSHCLNSATASASSMFSSRSMFIKSWQGRSAISKGISNDNLSKCCAPKALHQKVANEMILVPTDWMEGIEQFWKDILFLSNHTVQRMAPLISSTIYLSFKGIKASIHYKSAIEVQQNSKLLLCAAIQVHNWLIKEQRTNKWLALSCSPQKTQLVSPCHPFFLSTTLVKSLFLFNSHKKTLTLSGIFDPQMESYSWLTMPPNSSQL